MWFYEYKGSQKGPVDKSEIHLRLSNGELSSQTLVWREGLDDWLPVGQFIEFRETGKLVDSGAEGVIMQPQGLPGNVLSSPSTQNSLALTSMILGIIGIVMTLSCGVGILCAIPAVICGHLSRRQIKDSVIMQTGEGMAITGLITGYLVIVLSIILGIVLFVLLYSAASSSGTSFP